MLIASIATPDHFAANEGTHDMTHDILTYSLNCLAILAFTIIDLRADFSFWFFPGSNPDDILDKEKKRQISCELKDLQFSVLHHSFEQRLIDKPKC